MKPTKEKSPCVDLHQYIRDRIIFDLQPKNYGGRRTVDAIAGNTGDPRRETGYTLSVLDVQPVLNEMVADGTIIEHRGAYMLTSSARVSKINNREVAQWTLKL